MYNEKLLVGDIGINFKSMIHVEDFGKYFPKADNSSVVLCLSQFKGDYYFQTSNPYRIIEVEGKIGSHLFRKVMCYLADAHSEIYSTHHASGISLNEKGLLFAGYGGSGKSTMAKIFPSAKPLDDDLIMVTENEMSVSGKMGSVTIEKFVNGEKKKFLRYLDNPNSIKNHPLDFVFLLDKNHSGGYCNEVAPYIQREYSCLDSSSIKHLSSKQMQLPNPKVNARVFVLGTNGELERTKGCIEDVISS